MCRGGRLIVRAAIIRLISTFRPAHVDNTRHLHLTAVPTHFSGPLWRIVQVRFILFPQTASSPPLSSVTAHRFSRWGSDWSFPHECQAPPLNSDPIQEPSTGPSETLEWMGKAARSGLHMNERAKLLAALGIQRSEKNGFSFHNLREANWAVMRGTSPLSLTAGNSITSHANWPGLSFLGGNPGNS